MEGNRNLLLLVALAMKGPSGGRGQETITVCTYRYARAQTRQKQLIGEHNDPQGDQNQRYINGPNPDLYRSQISPGVAQERISRSMRLYEENKRESTLRAIIITALFDHKQISRHTQPNQKSMSFSQFSSMPIFFRLLAKKKKKR